MQTQTRRTPIRHESETGTGPYYYRARYYDQSLGRFISEDPLGFDGGDVNFYQYAGGQPINVVDPSGLKPGDKYKSIDCAGWDAIHDILPKTKQDGLEHGGFIIQNPDGTFSYTQPIRGTPTGLPNFFSIPIPTGTSPAGWYHTHPHVPGYNGQTFSSGDIWTSAHLNNSNSHPIRGPGYLGTPTNLTKRFTLYPGKNWRGDTVTIPQDPCGCK
jgi:RHS repeat-associated protein